MITEATSIGPRGSVRTPGSTTSMTSIISISRRSGRRLRRSSTAFATMLSTSPASSTATCTSVGFADTVTGVKMSAATEMIRIAAFTASTRPKRLT